MGRYVFTPEIFESIDRTKPGDGGEIQLTDAIGVLLPDLDVYGYTFDEGRYDIGKKLDYLRATVELALAREDLGPEFRAWLAPTSANEGIADLSSLASGGRSRRDLGPRSPRPARVRQDRLVIPLSDAQAHVLSRVAPLEPRRTWTVAAVGCVLAETVTSPEDVPPFANTAMDGYAVRAADLGGASADAPVELPVVAEVAAGHPADGRSAPARRCGS